MHDDWIRGLVRIGGTLERAPLQTFPSVGHRTLIRGFGQGQALHANPETGRVHHGKHRRHAPVSISDEVTLRFIEVDGASRRSADPHLVLDRGAAHAVLSAQVPFAVNVPLRHEE